MMYYLFILNAYDKNSEYNQAIELVSLEYIKALH